MLTNSSLKHDDLANNYHHIQSQIKSACAQAFRDPADIRLVAVSKGHDFSQIRELYRLGHRDFGESYAQEFSKKLAMAKSENLDIVWHFLGAIQTNKIKLIADAQFIHSVGSIKHAQLLDKISLMPCNIFLQINLDKNPKRQGFFSEMVLWAAKEISVMKNLKLMGIMTILPQDPKYKPGFWFQKMVGLKQALIGQLGVSQIALSMGMSDDFGEAIKYGADFVRIGTNIFGPRY